MTRLGPTVRDIRIAADKRPDDILAWCGLSERFGGRSANYISMCNPRVAEEHPSFTIWYKGGTLSFREENGTAKGDVLGFVAYMNGWHDNPKKGLPEVCRFLTEKLGLAVVDRAQLARDRATAKHAEITNRKTADTNLKRQQGEAFKLFIDAAPIRGTLAWRYLKEARNVDLDLLPRGPRNGDLTPGSLRFIAKHRHTESGLDLPCMIACCTNPATGDIKAVHRTWLARDGRDKASALPGWNTKWPARKVWPSFTGLVIPLWRGSSGLSVSDAAKHGILDTLQMGEGVEKSLAMTLAQPDYRTWAFISLGNLRNVPVPPCADGVIVQRDNEWDNPQAAQSFNVGLRALEARGCAVSEVRAFYGKDFDDTLRGE